MSRPRTAMRKIRDVLRLTFAEQLSRRQVSASLGIPFTTICEYVKRAAQAGLGWPLPEGLDDAALEARLFVRDAPPVQARPLPDWNYVHRELRRPGVTLMLLHLEYRERFPEGYQYSQRRGLPLPGAPALDRSPCPHLRVPGCPPADSGPRLCGVQK